MQKICELGTKILCLQTRLYIIYFQSQKVKVEQFVPLNEMLKFSRSDHFALSNIIPVKIRITWIPAESEALISNCEADRSRVHTTQLYQ